MSYINENLKANEQIIFETRLHWLKLVQSLLWSWILFFIPSIFVLLKIITTEFAVTNQRIIIKKGILSRNIAEFPLAKVQNVNLSQSVFGRMFNYGTLVVQTAATYGANIFPFVKNASELRRHISDRIG
jgi:uncharacterized membrane protein YdbT with pleckstrin-like domain